MAPQKVGKRAAKAAAGPPAKKQKSTELAGVEEAVKMAGLPPMCQEMLLAAAPLSLTTPGDLREGSQVMIVDMIGAEVEAVCARLAEAHGASSEALAACEASKEGLETKAQEAEAAATAAAEAAAAKATAAAAAGDAVTAAKAAQREAQEAQRAGDAELEKARARSAELDEALKVHLEAVSEGEPDAVKSGFEKLRPLLPQLGIDDSLLSALPSTCNKAASERGPFDLVVLSQLRASLEEKSAAAAQVLANGEPSGQARAAAVEAATASLDEAARAQQQAAEALAGARAEQEAAEQTARAARREVTGHGPELKRLTQARDAAAGALQQFMDYNVVCFQTLRDRSSTPPPPPAPAADEAPADAAPAEAVQEEAAPPAKLIDDGAAADAAADAPTAAAGA